MTFRNTIQIGAGCKESMLKADGDAVQVIRQP